MHQARGDREYNWNVKFNKIDYHSIWKHVILPVSGVLMIVYPLLWFKKCIFTVRNSSCGKVMFLHLSVILFTGEGVFAIAIAVVIPIHSTEIQVGNG